MKHTLDQTYTRLDAHIHTVKHEINIRSYTQSDIRRIKDAYAHDQKRKTEPHIIRHTQDQTSHTHTHDLMYMLSTVMLSSSSSSSSSSPSSFLFFFFLFFFSHDITIQNTQEIKRTLFNWTKQDRRCKFSRKSSFSNYVQHKNRKTDN